MFDDAAHEVQDVKWLGQGTIYPDVIESVSVKGPSATIKSHHNVGGLPDFMKLKVVEPLNTLFKDEVRRVGKALGIDPNILGRHPFPARAWLSGYWAMLRQKKLPYYRRPMRFISTIYGRTVFTIKFGRQALYFYRYNR